MPSATTNMTILDIAKKNGSDPLVGLIDETSKAHPEITDIAARTVKGISFKTWVRTALPAVAFRNGNEGVAPGKSLYENREVNCFILTPRIEADKAVADADEDGAESYITYEGQATMEATMQLLGKTFYYGRNSTFGGDVKGHPGLIDSYDRTKYEVDAGGTTDSTATSVWAVVTGQQNVQWCFGLNGTMTLSDIMIQRVTDANSNPYTAYVQEISMRPGLQVGSLRGVGRIKKLTDDAGKGLTDALLAKLLSQFEVGVKPDMFLMNRRARRQLQLSRTVTLFGNSNQKVSGKEATLAPTPTEYDGVPIKCTDSISDIETLAL